MSEIELRENVDVAVCDVTVSGVIDIVVAPEPRNPSNLPRKARFIARQGVSGRVLGTFTAPLLGAARVLLAERFPPETKLQIRHAGSATVAMTATVGVAANLTVNEDASTGAPRFAKWRPFAAFDKDPDKT
jgi:hypothetical protein